MTVKVNETNFSSENRRKTSGVELVVHKLDKRLSIYVKSFSLDIITLASA